MRRFLMAAASLTFALSPFATAQNETVSDETKRAFAAGYKALFTCSATFLADQPRAVIQANELDGIYQGYRPLMVQVSDANINDRRRQVSVRYSETMPPRIAAYRPGMGCSLLPIGAEPASAKWLPAFDAPPPEPEPDTSTALGDTVEITDNVLALDRLGAPVSFAFDSQTYGEGTRTSAVVVLHKGQVIAEQYARGMNADKPQRTWSVAKSLTATIIGAAVQDGLLGLDNEAVIEAFSKGGDPRREITLRHVLNMASGLESGTRGSRTDRSYFGGAAAMDRIPAAVLEAAPGSRFKYSNNDTLIAMRALREALGDDGKYHAYPYSAVLNKIGAKNTVLETDWQGDFISSSQVWMSARDMARLGQLYLQDGRWGDEQILPADWVSFITKPAPAQPQSGEFGYGGSFWLIGGVEGAPDDTYAGLGNRGQYLIVVPSRELVIVRRGYDVAGLPRFNVAKFAGDVTAAIDAVEAARLEAEAAALAEEEAARLANEADEPVVEFRKRGRTLRERLRNREME